MYCRDCGAVLDCKEDRCTKCASKINGEIGNIVFEIKCDEFDHYFEECKYDSMDELVASFQKEEREYFLKVDYQTDTVAVYYHGCPLGEVEDADAKETLLKVQNRIIYPVSLRKVLDIGEPDHPAYLIRIEVFYYRQEASTT